MSRSAARSMTANRIWRQILVHRWSNTLSFDENLSVEPGCGKRQLGDGRVVNVQQFHLI